MIKADFGLAQLTRSILALGLVIVIATGSFVGALAQSDPLPSWNDGAAKKAIADFVARVTTQGGADFVAPAERIAVFVNFVKMC